MITQEFRPRSFKEVAGHELVIKTLKCIVRNPEKAPRTIILQGQFGTGKTTCARIFARALNCPNQKGGEPCGECEICKDEIENTMFYDEYDSAIIGNVDTIKSLRENFTFNADFGYKVICLDEVHLASSQAQSALLKVLEETRGRVFFVLATTHIDKILPTIRSRSLELRFNLIPESEIISNLKSIAERKGLVINEPILEIIAQRSGGHMRNAHMLLDQYNLLGDEFLNAVKSSRDIYLKFIAYSLQGNKEGVSQCIFELQHFSLADLKTDYESLILEIIKTSLKVIPAKDPVIERVGTLFSQHLFKMVNILKSDVVMNSFNTDKQFQAAMYLVFSLLGGNRINTSASSGLPNIKI